MAVHKHLRKKQLRKRLGIPKKERPSILGDYPFTADELVWLIGRGGPLPEPYSPNTMTDLPSSQPIGTFVLLRHLPSGRSRSQMGVGSEGLHAVQRKLLALLYADVSFDPYEIRIDSGETGVGPFIRVRHVPSGLARSQAGLNGATRAEVERQLLIGLQADLTAANTAR